MTMDAIEFRNKVFPLKDKLYRIALRLLENSDDAQDAVQDAFIKLWNRKERLPEYQSVEALGVVTVRNLCLDRIRLRKLPADDLDRAGGLPVEDRFDEVAARKETIGQIHRIIGTLPEVQQTILQLRDVEGYEYETIAEVVGMNVNAVRVSLARARKKIRDTYWKIESHEYQRN